MASNLMVQIILSIIGVSSNYINTSFLLKLHFTALYSSSIRLTNIYVIECLHTHSVVVTHEILILDIRTDLISYNIPTCI